MSSVASELQAFQQARFRSLVWPREHGAWGILCVPLVTGGRIGLFRGNGIAGLALFAVASLALFCLRTPLEAWLQTSPLRPRTPSERRAVLYSILAYASLAAATLTVLLWREHAYGLLILGAAVGAMFLAQAILKKLGRETRMTAQLIGSLGLTSTAAGGYYVVTGRLDSRALVLWAANWLFAANQIHFVQVRLHAARASTRMAKLVHGKAFLVGEFPTGLLLLLAWRSGSLPGLAVLAFFPVLTRGLLWFLRRPGPLAIHRLGYSELAYALAFGALFILGFYL